MHLQPTAPPSGAHARTGPCCVQSHPRGEMCASLPVSLVYIQNFQHRMQTVSQPNSLARAVFLFKLLHQIVRQLGDLRCRCTLRSSEESCKWGSQRVGGTHLGFPLFILALPKQSRMMQSLDCLAFAFDRM